MNSDSPGVRSPARLFFVDAASGRIWPTDAPEETSLETIAARLDEVQGRSGSTYRLHARNPAPGEATGYYVYRDSDDAGARESRDGDRTIRDFEVVGFVEVIQASIMSRLRLEPEGETEDSASASTLAPRDPAVGAGVEPPAQAPMQPDEPATGAQ